MDMDTHEFKYSIFPFVSVADAERKASELNFGLRTVMGSFHKGNLSEKAGYIENMNDNIIITAIKKSEDSDNTVIRLFEANGENTNVKIEFFDRKIDIKADHDQIKTLILNEDEIKELNICEM